MHTHDDQLNKPDQNDVHATALNRLEDMWDRKILKGDDYDSLDFDLPPEEDKKNSKRSKKGDEEVQKSKTHKGRSM